MAIDIDTGHALRRPGELAQLVQAILAANPNDESHWLEWKASLDLSTRAGRLHLGRAVLGMSNRMPDLASPVCEGVGYIVVGVEPGRLAGVAPVDAAQLDDGLSPYLGGAKGPNWGATYLDLNGLSVLVVSVEAPAWGHPIFTLRRSYDSYSAGTVFVRKHGKTAPADDHDMDLLQARLRALSRDPLNLDVTVFGDVPLSWFDPSTVAEAIDNWVESRRSGLIANAENIDRSRKQIQSLDLDNPRFAAQGLATNLQRLASTIANPLVTPDERTLDDYVNEVDEWSDRLREAARGDWPTRYLDRGHGVVRLKVTNPTDRNIGDVLLKATFPGHDVTGLDERPYTGRLPSPPRRFGEPIRMDYGLSIIPAAQHLFNDPVIAPLRSTWVEDGSVRIGWSVGDLRPQDTDESDDVYVFVRSRPEDGVLRGTWEATSKSTDGVLKGELLVPVSAKPIDVGSLFKASSEVDGS